MANTPNPTYDAYSSSAQAQSILQRRWRFRWSYISTKALTDWELMDLADPAGKRVLNVGCAEPIDEFFFASLVKQWVAIDFAPSQLVAARQTLEDDLSPEKCARIHLCAADAAHLPFADDTFDLVVSFSVIEHIPSKAHRQAAVKEIARVTRPGGKVIITLPNLFSMHPLADIIWGITGKKNYGYACSYIPFLFKQELKRAGLKPLRYTSEYKIPTWPRFMNLLPMCFGMRFGYLAQKE